MKHKKNLTIIIPLLLLVCTTSFGQVSTRLVVRALAKDAKFIGSSIGGAFVVVKDPLTNEVIASGLTTGSTGNTSVLMGPHERGQQLADDNTAKFETSIVLDKPRFVQVDVFSPYAKRQATQLSSKQLWLLPGKHIDGDGLVIEIPGFIIDILNPRTHQFVGLDQVKGKKTEIRVNMVMMCGCTIEPGGRWNGDKMEVEATILKDGQQVDKVAMKNIEKNTFQAFYEFTQKGNYEIIVTGFDPVTKNTGADKVPFVID